MLVKQLSSALVRTGPRSAARRTCQRRIGDQLLGPNKFPGITGELVVDLIDIKLEEFPARLALRREDCGSDGGLGGSARWLGRKTQTKLVALTQERGEGVAILR